MTLYSGVRRQALATYVTSSIITIFLTGDGILWAVT